MVISLLIAAGSLAWACISSGGSHESFEFQTDEERPLSPNAACSAGGAIDAPLVVASAGGLAATSAKPMPGEAAYDAADEAAVSEAVLTTSHFTFFHFVMLLASMYMAMVISSWAVGAGTVHDADGDCIDSGETVLWVKVGTLWATLVLYIWTIIAPKLFPDRDWGLTPY